MLKSLKDQHGVTHLVTVLAVLAITIVGVVALRIGSAQRLKPGYTFPSYTQPTFTQPTSPSYSQPTAPSYDYPSYNRPSYNNGASSGSVCTSNGHKITAPAGSSCSINTNNNEYHCFVDNAERACDY